MLRQTSAANYGKKNSKLEHLAWDLFGNSNIRILLTLQNVYIDN